MGTSGEQDPTVTMAPRSPGQLSGSLPARLIERIRAQRPGRVGVTAAAGWVSRIISALAQLVGIRLLTGMLGVEGFGAFAVMTGLLGWFSLCDLGLGASLQNHISQQRVAGRSSIAAISTVVAVTLVAMVVFSILWVAIAPWAGPALLHRFPGVSARQATEAFAAFSVIATGTGLGLVAIKLCYAEHRGYIGHAMTAAAVLLGVGGLALLSLLHHDHDLTWALVVYQAPSWILPMGFLLGHAWRRRHEPGFRLAINRPVLALLWQHARVFLTFGVFAAAVLNVDYIIISQTIAGPDAAVYAVYAKIFTLAFFVFNSVIQAYWPVCSELVHRRRFDEIDALVRRCLIFGSIVVLGAGVVIYLLRGLIADLAAPGDSLVLPGYLIPLFVVYWLVRVWCDTYAMLVQSANETRILVRTVPAQAAVNLVLGYAGATTFGLSGLLIGMTASFALTVAWILPRYLKTFRMRIEKETPR